MLHIQYLFLICNYHECNNLIKLTFCQNYKMSKHSKKTVKSLGNSVLSQDKKMKSVHQDGVSKLRASNSENDLNKNTQLKPTLSRRSWSFNQKPVTEETIDDKEDIVTNLQRLKLNDDSDDYDCNSNLLRARDSLENLLKTERLIGNEETKSDSPSTSSSPDALSPRSLPALNDIPEATVTSKSSAWKSNEKKGRKSKDKKKKGNKSTDVLSLRGKKVDNIEYKPGDEKASNTSNNSTSDDIPYETKSARSVVFTNEVMVVYFNGENIVYESKEPLKKELEQQVRNKEMRRGHVSLN